MIQSFTNIRYPIGVDASLGRLDQETSYARHVEQLILQVLFTAPGERVNRPDFGCGIRRLIFAPNSEVAASLAQVTIFEALKRWLDAVITVDDLKVLAKDSTLELRLTYTLKARGERFYLNLEVTA